MNGLQLHAHSQKYDVFISYASQDRDWVRDPLLSTLELAQARVCIDYRDFPPGQAIVQAIETAIQTSRKTLLVLSSNYLNSDWTTFEAILLQTLDPANLGLRLIPLLKNPCNLPLRLKSFGYLNFVDPVDPILEWQRLLQALGLNPITESFPPVNSNVSLVNTPRRVSSDPQRSQILISYHPQDQNWLDKLQRMLSPLKQSGRVQVWDQSQIQAGHLKQQAIQSALDQAKIAVLLVSADYLDYEPIVHGQLPYLLQAAEQEQIRILWFLVGPCLWEMTPIAPITPVYDPSVSLSELPKAKQEAALQQIAQQIAILAQSA